ncbi:pilin [Patescibacteria group bacterium]|nr:pilin [Patescibacteria group bacterium]
MKNKIQFYFKLILPLLYLFFAKVSLAAGLVPCGNPGEQACTVCHLLKLLSNIALFIVRTAMPPLAGLLFLIGGIMMIASAGSEERYKKAKAIIINTAIGVVIVLGSWVIVNTIIVTLGQNVAGFQVENWWQPPQCP